MGQNRKNRKGNPRGLNEFDQEVYEDLMIERVIGYRQIMVTVFIAGLVILREAYFPSQLFIKDVFLSILATTN